MGSNFYDAFMETAIYAYFNTVNCRLQTLSFSLDDSTDVFSVIESF